MSIRASIGVAVLQATVLLFAACSSPPPAPAETVQTEPPPPAPPAFVPPPAQDTARCEDRLAAADATVKGLNERIETLEAELERARAEAEKYQQGLDRAVRYINGTGPAPGPARRGGAETGSDIGRITVLGSPAVTPFGDEVEVSGKLYSTRDRPQTVYLDVELTADGEYVDSASLELTLRPHQALPWSVRLEGAEGALEAHVSIEEE